MESLDRPYGDDEQDHRTIEPELRPEPSAPAPGGGEPTTDSDERMSDPAFQAVVEGGGGVAEGFETAEGQLVENVEGAPPADLTPDGFDPADAGTDVEEDAADDVARVLEEQDPGDAVAAPREREAQRAGAEYGEPDQVDVTEVVRDPGEEAAHGDDPGAGPGVAFDR